MTAKTTRPLLIVLLFGFFPTSGWMIVRGGTDTTRTLATSCPVPAGAAAHRRAPAPPWPAAPAPRAGVYAQPSALNAPRPGKPLSDGAPDAARVSGVPQVPSGGPNSPAAAAAPIDDAGDSAAGTADYAYDSSDGFGDFGVPGALPGAGGSGAPASGGGAGSGSAETSGPSHSVAGGIGFGSHTGSGPSGGSGGPGSNGTGGGPGAPSGTSGVGLQDPPGGTGGLSPTVKDPTGTGSTHLTDVAEPSTLALLAAGAGALGLIMRRRRCAG